MSLPGQIALPNGVIRSPKWLSSNLVSILQPDLMDVWIGESIVLDTLNNVDNWPSMLRNRILINSHISNRFKLSKINGRQTLFTSVASGKSLKIDMTSVKTFIVLVTMPTLPFADYESAIVSGSNQVITGSPGTNTLYTGQSIDRYIDNVLTNTVSPGIHMIESSVSGASTSWCVGGIDGSYPDYPTRDWLADIGCIIALSNQPSMLQRIAVKSCLNQYYQSSF